ncbi:MAG TPA: hypothetical protein VFG72_10890 [Marmoricola sp.]|nr:hypothetical protein [Marmoricola sp.]
MYLNIQDPASALTFATMHQDELIADARARRRAREATQARRAARRRRRLIH